MKYGRTILQDRSNTCAVKCHNVVDGYTGPFELSEEKHTLITLRNYHVHVTIPRKVVREYKAQDLCKANTFEIYRVHTNGVKRLFTLLEIDHHFFAFVGVEDQLVVTRPRYDLLYRAMDMGDAVTINDLAQGSIIHKFPRVGIWWPKVVDHEEEEPWT